RELADGSEWIAPGRKGCPMSQNTMLFALYRMGYHSRATMHGFRSTASTILIERGFAPDWIERQLAHVPGHKVRSAYNAAEYLPGRRKMMDWWSDYLDQQATIGSCPSDWCRRPRAEPPA
ncbi:MAG: tyrosine-type recombinase/integrase, partial [Pikeienuella sp.]